MKVGDKIWRFDSNRRVYTKSSTLSSPPNRRQMWHEVEITGETSRSWVTAYGKVPKRGAPYGWAFTRQAVEDDLWCDRNCYNIATAVTNSTRVMRDRSALRDEMTRIAAIIGFETSE